MQMDVLFSEDQEILRSAVRDFVERECGIATVRAIAEGGKGLPPALWKKLADLGWLGLCIPEEYGGAGLRCLDLVVMLEEMGRSLFPGAFLSAVVGSLALVIGGNEAQKRRLLPALACGEQRATLALYEGQGPWSTEGVALEARAAAAGFALRGVKRFVPEANTADWLVVPARTSDDSERGLTLFLVSTHGAGVSIESISTTDTTRIYSEVVFADAYVTPEAVLGTVGGGGLILERIIDRAKLALCADACGGAQRVLELSVAYARSREQFGRPIGSQQAIQHRCADMLVRVEGARSATWRAAWCLDEEEPLSHSASCMAKAYTSDAFLRVAGDGIQIHGGLGFTWEQDLHLFFKRAALSSVLFGDSDQNRELVARALLD
jgi:alkylation response protein AidB-like acyl-CoA dehydrogenase